MNVAIRLPTDRAVPTRHTLDSQSAETEALDILKGAEVERSALLKANKTESEKDKTKAEVSTQPTSSSPMQSTSTDVASTS